jgi:hypothetical protein
MLFATRVNVFRFSFFYLLESAPFILVAGVVGFIISFATEYDWAIASLLLAAFFSHRLVLSIKFNGYLDKRERAHAAGVDVGPFNTMSVAAYAAAFLGAVAGWQLALYIDYFAIAVIPLIFIPGFYIVEVFRRAREF